MEYTDLNEEIMANDWLIPKEEISRRRLLRKTPRFNIYKADWFGEVLIYEPVSSSSPQVSDTNSKSLNIEELNWKLESFLSSKSAGYESSSAFRQSPLNEASHIPHQTLPLVPLSPTDSAYSSLTSTPQHNTKQLSYEFPSMKHESEEAEVESEQETVSENSSMIEDSTPVVLNKDSYKFGPSSSQQLISRLGQQEADGQSSKDWSELNELRLIAHESFILFLGATIEEEFDGEQKRSLVMQMSHPKAVSLHNLLHANFEPRQSKMDQNKNR